MPITINGAATLLQVVGMPASLAFYHYKLGFIVADTFGQGVNSGWVLLKPYGVQLMLNTAYEDPVVLVKTNDEINV